MPKVSYTRLKQQQERKINDNPITLFGILSYCDVILASFSFLQLQDVTNKNPYTYPISPLRKIGNKNKQK